MGSFASHGGGLGNKPQAKRPGALGGTPLLPPRPTSSSVAAAVHPLQRLHPSPAPGGAATPAAAGAAPAAGVGAGAPGAAAGSPLVNTAPIQAPTYKPTTTVNPDLVELKNNYTARIRQSQAKENAADPRLTEHYNTLRERLSTDTTGRAIGRASLAIADQAAGQRAAAAERDEARGVGGSGAAADTGDRIGEAARRRAAGAAADISLARERDLDSLTLGGLGIAAAQGNLDVARAGQTNSLLAAAPGVVGAPAADARADRALGISEFDAQTRSNQAAASQNLAERGFGLNQYSTQAGIDIQRQQLEEARRAREEQAWRDALLALPYGV